MKFFSLILLLLSFGMTEMAFATSDVNDIQSMVRRDSTHYDVVCRDGSKEVVSIDDIHNNNVCGKRQPEPPSNVVAIFSRPDNSFFVLCDNNSWEVATDDAIRAGRVCSTNSSDGLPSGTFVDERNITLKVSISQKDIVLAWPSTGDTANGLYKCSGSPIVCVHTSGYQVQIQNERSFVWTYQGIGTFHFNKTPDRPVAPPPTAGIY